jgi:hypothetical protein
MKLTVGAALPIHQHAVTIECELMHGDADGYQTITFGPFYHLTPEGKDELVQHITMLKKLEKEQDPDEYDNIQEWYDDFRDDWPMDSTCADMGLGRPASLDEFQVIYHDEAGVRFKATVEI